MQAETSGTSVLYHEREDILRYAQTLIPGYDPGNVADPDRYYFDIDAAEQAVWFFSEYLVHIKGELASLPLEPDEQGRTSRFVLAPWQVAIVANIFGWKRAQDDLRRYREVFVFVPRKNGKTMLVAGLALVVFFTDGEPGAEIMVGAAERDQAGILFNLAREMVVRNPELTENCTPLKRVLAKEASASKLWPISSEAATKHGLNAHCAIIDELHAQPDGDLYDVLMTSMGARRQPLMVSLTTSDFDREGSICNEKHRYASDVRDGIVPDETFLPVIWEAEKDDDWTDPAVWAKANPSLGVSVSEEFLRKEAGKAEAVPRYVNTFKRLYLNIRTGQDVRWLDMEAWDACKGTAEMIGAGELTYSAFKKFLRGRRCYAGLDLASTNDLTALVLVFPFHASEVDEDADPGELDVSYFILPYFWVPADRAVEREKTDRVFYFQWAKQGWIELIPGKTIRFDIIERRIRTIAEEFEIVSLGFDRWQGEHMAQNLDALGFDLVRCAQRMADLSAPSKELEKLIVEGRIVHGGHPVLRWNAANCATAEDNAGNIMPSKKHSGEKIDGIAGTVMALGLAMEDKPRRNVYEERIQRGEAGFLQI